MATNLYATKREDHRRAVTKKLRSEGLIPAVVYGKDKKTQSVSVESIELLKTMRDEGRNAIISLDVEKGDTLDVMVHDYQKDPVKGGVTHIDFYVVDLKEEMDVEVPIVLTGEAEGTKEGGVLQQPLYELQLRAKPREIPEEISVDISELDIGDSLSVADITVTGDYELLDDPDTTIVTVSPPEEEEEEEETVDASVEPDLVGADEDEEEEEE